MILSDLNGLRDETMVKFKEEDVDGTSYTIVSYMIGNSELWKKPFSLEARGITFETDTGKCVSRPFAKFFNVGENVDTQPEIVKSRFSEVFEKRDGSMVTPVVTKTGSLWFKTKKSFYSDVANTANKLVTEGVRNICLACCRVGITPIFEFTHIDHKIVLDYSPKLNWTLLALRDNDDGSLYPSEFVECLGDVFGVDVIPEIDISWGGILYSVENDTNIEGYVLRLSDGRLAKMKTRWYLSMHRVMTDLRERDVADAVLNETVDDLKSFVSSQGKGIDLIEEVEARVLNDMRQIKSDVDAIVQQYKGKTFKDAAIALKEEPLFSLVMSELRGLDARYSDYWKKNYRHLYRLRVLYNPSFSKEDS